MNGIWLVLTFIDEIEDVSILLLQVLLVAFTVQQTQRIQKALARQRLRHGPRIFRRRLRMAEDQMIDARRSDIDRFLLGRHCGQRCLHRLFELQPLIARWKLYKIVVYCILFGNKMQLELNLQQLRESECSNITIQMANGAIFVRRPFGKSIAR